MKGSAVRVRASAYRKPRKRGAFGLRGGDEWTRGGNERGNTAPDPKHLLLQVICLSRAQFDMRCAESLSWDLEEGHDNDIGPRGYGLFTGLAVSYARPFTTGDGNPYGPLDGKWSKFPGRPELMANHTMLIQHRNTLLAHNDLTAHRTTIVWPSFVEGRATVLEARSPLKSEGARQARELCQFQQTRFGAHVQDLVERLVEQLGWQPDTEINLDEELTRLRKVGQT